MDANLGIRFENNPDLQFVQGEDRSILCQLYDKCTNRPIDLTDALISVNIPRQGGGTIKRTDMSLTALPSNVTLPQGAPGYFTIPDHGYVTGDSVQFEVSGTPPSPLSNGGAYLVQVIDNNSFYLVRTGTVQNLTTQGSGTFTFNNNTNDIVISDNPINGEFTLQLRAVVTAVANAALGQAFQVAYSIGGATRIIVLPDGLDVIAQPNP